MLKNNLGGKSVQEILLPKLCCKTKSHASFQSYYAFLKNPLGMVLTSSCESVMVDNLILMFALFLVVLYFEGGLQSSLL